MGGERHHERERHARRLNSHMCLMAVSSEQLVVETALLEHRPAPN
jgi:hypothetical protein